MLPRRSILIEIATASAAILFLIYLLRSVLVFGEATFGHDNILWHYPIYQFYAENVVRGDFPFWNPFSHGGEPFYVLLGQFRLLDPITFPVVYIGHFFTSDIPILFGWDRIIRGLVLAFGIYIVFRPWTGNIFVRLSLIPILLFSSFTLAAFRQDGFLDQVIWVPWLAFFLLRIVYYHDLRWRNWLALGVFIGLNWQSYFFSGTWIFLLFMAIGLAAFRRDLLWALFRSKSFRPKTLVLALIVFGLALPMLSLVPLQGESVYPPRMIDYDYRLLPPVGSPVQYESGFEGRSISAFRMPYDYINHTGSFSTTWDFIQAISPEGNEFARGFSPHSWGDPSEAFMYVGLLVWALVILGVVSGRHNLKAVWLVLLVGFGLLLLGPAGGLHRVLYYAYPPLWFVRHTHGLFLIFLFCALYFYVLGFNRLIESGRGTFQSLKSNLAGKRWLAAGLASLIFSVFFVLLGYWINRLEYPATNYLIFPLGFIFLVGWLLKRVFGNGGLYASLIVSFIVLVLVYSPNRDGFLLHLVLFLGIPVGFITLFMAFARSRKAILIYLPILLLAFLTADLVQNFTASSYLYQWRAPSGVLNASTVIEEARFPETRHSYAEYPSPSPYMQDMRYLAIVHRQPYVFSSVNPGWSNRGLFEPPGQTGQVPFGDLINASFELWTPSPQGSDLPSQWGYEQGGDGGSVQRRTDAGDVANGSTSIWVQPSSAGHSFVRFESFRLQQVRGRRVVFSISVKSDNNVADAIQLDVQDNIGSMALQSYGNSGQWERLEVAMEVAKNATRLYLTLNVRSIASHGALFDGSALVYLSPAPGTTEYALEHKRWNSFFLSKSYFDLVNSDLSPLVLDEMFAVNKPLLQFKGQSLQLNGGDTLRYLREIGADQSVSLLGRAVIVNGPDLSELSLAKDSAQEYASLHPLPQTGTAVLSAGTLSEGVAQDALTYVIEDYDYDSLKLRTSSQADGFLYWADGYAEDWHAAIDGKEVPLYRANVNFKAIQLPAGTHEVSFIYDPSTFKWALFVFYGLILASLLGVIVDSRTNIKSWFLAAGGLAAALRVNTRLRK